MEIIGRSERSLQISDILNSNNMILTDEDVNKMTTDHAVHRIVSRRAAACTLDEMDYGLYGYSWCVVRV